VKKLADAYDEVSYPSLPRNQSHPAFISALSRIAGLELPPVEQWRVLEIGCGDGSNLIPLAFDYPEGKFVGVDRAVNPIGVGRGLAARLRLANIELHAADLLDWQPEGKFDYIIAHAVYSWVPEEVREKLFRICSVALQPQGVAFISYNALPGCHFRRFVWDFLRFHVRHLTDPAARMEKARDLVRRIAGQTAGEGAAQNAVRREMETVLKRDDAALFHDDLAPTNDPFYLLDFVARAARHGLQYLGDADPQRDDVRDVDLLSENWIESRQYGDFLARRRFRETLLCRQGIFLDRKLLLDRLRDLYVASRVTPVEPEKDGQQRFDLPQSRNLTTNHPLAKQALCRLTSLWPGSLRISELPVDEYPAEATADLLMRLLQAGALELRVHPPKIAASVSDHPVASALARAQIAEGYSIVTNQRHIGIGLEDEISRKVLSLLDGSRDRRELARELAGSNPDPEMIDRTLDDGLAGLHRLCLLTG
jgi:SAM-dependent methyltransferase